MEQLEQEVYPSTLPQERFTLHLQYRDWQLMSQLSMDTGIQADVNLGRVPVISWNCGDDISPTHDPTHPLNLVQIANGLADQDLATIRAQLLSFKDVSGRPYPFILRYFWEFNINASQSGPPYDNLQTGQTNGNGYCFLTPGSPTGINVEATAPPLTKQFTDAWNHIHAQLQGNQPIPNLTWDWNPNVQDSDPQYHAQPIVDPSPFYPGNATVDWIGIDGYSKLDGKIPKSFGQIFDQWYNVYSSAVFNKPLMVAETASCQFYGLNSILPDQLAYIQSLQTLLNSPPNGGQYPSIKALMYFNAPGAYEPLLEQNHCKYHFDTQPENGEPISPLQGFTNLANDPNFSPKINP